MSPLKNVPVVKITAPAVSSSPHSVITPFIQFFSTKRSPTAASLISRFSWWRRASCMASRYSFRSACARGPRTAAPLLAFNTRNWIPERSITRPMTPSRASISRTIWPLARPPIAGLQDISPIVSTLWVSKSVLAPTRAAADAASQPACPPPITITSKSIMNSLLHHSIKWQNNLSDRN